MRYGARMRAGTVLLQESAAILFKTYLIIALCQNLICMPVSCVLDRNNYLTATFIGTTAHKRRWPLLPNLVAFAAVSQYMLKLSCRIIEVCIAMVRSSYGIHNLVQGCKHLVVKVLY